MAHNPLLQHFRQPKIFIDLPSKGIYNAPGTLSGDPVNMPIYGMTGMDEIVMKTPDALMTGESTVKVIQSCCPGIKDAWALTSLDTDLVLTAIRIATYGNEMVMTKTCPACNSENEYAIELGKIIEHFGKCIFDKSVVVKDLKINVQPLSYRQSTDFALKNYQLQQRLAQTNNIENQEEQKRIIGDLFVELGQLQNEIFEASIESVEVGNQVVTERPYIKEWLANSDRSVFAEIRKQFDLNKEIWRIPKYSVKCEHCDDQSDMVIELDQTNFFVSA